MLDLFSGIGGFSLGLERAGMQTVAFCEIDPFCRRVLAKHWPGVPCYEDVCTLTAERLAADGIAADVVCGGFPCQDISFAGAGAGLAGERSGLWREYSRIIGELRPRYVLVENVSALLGRGLGDVLGDLATFGYDAEWHCIPASAVGAHHGRDRIWIVAHSSCEQHEGSGFENGRPAPEVICAVSDTPRVQPRRTQQRAERERARPVRQPIVRSVGRTSQWLAEPAVGRVAHGVPNRVDRLHALGNAVVPQIPEMIGRAIMAHAPTTPAHVPAAGEA